MLLYSTWNVRILRIAKQGQLVCNATHGLPSASVIEKLPEESAFANSHVYII